MFDNKWLAISLITIPFIIASCAGCISESRQESYKNDSIISSELLDLDAAQISDNEKEIKAYVDLVKGISEEEILIRTVEFASNGNVVALYVVGEMYLDGTMGLPRNDKEALHAFEMAASRGHAMSLIKLAQIYAKNKDDHQSVLVLSYCYASLGATFGSETGKILAKQFEKNLCKNFPQEIIDELHELVRRKYMMILRNIGNIDHLVPLITSNNVDESRHIFQLMQAHIEKKSPLVILLFL